MERAEVTRKPIEAYGQLCSHGSVPKLGHDCGYTSARNKLIPAAEALARKRMPQRNGQLHTGEFLAAMDELWLAQRTAGGRT